MADKAYRIEDGPYRVSRDDGDGFIRKYTVALPSEGEKVLDEPALNDSGVYQTQEIQEKNSKAKAEEAPK